LIYKSKEIKGIMVIMVHRFRNSLLENFCGVIKNHKDRRKIKEKGMDHMNGRMEESIMVNGTMELYMEWGYRCGKMEKIMLVFIVKIEGMASVLFNGPMEKLIKVTGNRENNTGWVSAKQLLVKFNVDCGKKENI